MSNTTEAKTSATRKKKLSAGLIVLLVVIVFLFLLSTIVLGSRLYEMATRDQYTVDMGLGEPDGSIELFRISYENELGQITVEGVNADNVVAPGTAVDYDIRLRNNDDVVIDFLMTPTVEFLTEDPVPVEFRMIDSYGNYILGDDETWVGADEMNLLYHKGSIHPGEVFTYHVSWRWVFEVSDKQNGIDTFLGNAGTEAAPGVRVGITTESVANPMPLKSNTHMMHLLGEGFGCCWCCYLVWLLILCCLLLVIWVMSLKKKLNAIDQPAAKDAV